MSHIYHKDLASGRWFQISLSEQMANIGSEVERAIKWRDKNNPEIANVANERALELFYLTLEDPKYSYSSLKEIARAKELWLDFFLGDNIYRQTAELWRKYFMAFNYKARNPNKIQS